jgi:hypothetical protein
MVALLADRRRYIYKDVDNIPDSPHMLKGGWLPAYWQLLRRFCVLFYPLGLRFEIWHADVVSVLSLRQQESGVQHNGQTGPA